MGGLKFAMRSTLRWEGSLFVGKWKFSSTNVRQACHQLVTRPPKHQVMNDVNLGPTKLSPRQETTMEAKEPRPMNTQPEAVPYESGPRTTQHEHPSAHLSIQRLSLFTQVASLCGSLHFAAAPHFPVVHDGWSCSFSTTSSMMAE